VASKGLSRGEAENENSPKVALATCLGRAQIMHQKMSGERETINGHCEEFEICEISINQFQKGRKKEGKELIKTSRSKVSQNGKVFERSSS